MSRDLKSSRAIVLKGVLFFGVAAIAGTLLFLRDMSWQTALLLLVLIWSSARAYYFLFYVLHAYVDPSLKYAGLMHMVRQLRTRRNSAQ